jgi:hypothetical protein
MPEGSVSPSNTFNQFDVNSFVTFAAERRREEERVTKVPLGNPSGSSLAARTAKTIDHAKIAKTAKKRLPYRTRLVPT